MKEYHKIETLFERETTGSKKLIEGVWRNPAMYYLANLDWVWTEKVDGTNIRIHWDGHEITYGGRTERAQIPVDLMNYLNRTFSNDETEQMFEQKFGETEVTLYGEGYGPKIQKGGGLYRDDASFILFDVLVGETWLKRDSVEDIARAFGVDAVPIINVGSLYKAIEYVKQRPMSHLSAKAPMEGLVVRPYEELRDRMGRRVIAKIKVKDFAV